MEGLTCKSASEVCRAREVIAGVYFFLFLPCVKFFGYGGVNLAIERACSIREEVPLGWEPDKTFYEPLYLSRSLKVRSHAGAHFLSMKI